MTAEKKTVTKMKARLSVVTSRDKSVTVTKNMVSDGNESEANV